MELLQEPKMNSALTRGGGSKAIERRNRSRKLRMLVWESQWEHQVNFTAAEVSASSLTHAAVCLPPVAVRTPSLFPRCDPEPPASVQCRLPSSCATRASVGWRPVGNKKRRMATDQWSITTHDLAMTSSPTLYYQAWVQWRLTTGLIKHTEVYSTCHSLQSTTWQAKYRKTRQSRIVRNAVEPHEFKLWLSKTVNIQVDQPSCVQTGVLYSITNTCRKVAIIANKCIGFDSIDHKDRADYRNPTGWPLSKRCPDNKGSIELDLLWWAVVDSTRSSPHLRLLALTNRFVLTFLLHDFGKHAELVAITTRQRVKEGTKMLPHMGE